MKRIFNLLLVPVIAFATIGPMASESVSAASDYDEILRPVHGLELISFSGTAQADVTASWANRVHNACGHDFLTSGSWSVSSFRDYVSMSHQSVNVYYSTNPVSDSLAWVNSYAPSLSLPSGIDKGASIYITDSGQISVFCFNVSSSYRPQVANHISATPNTDLRLYQTSLEINYPFGYEGEVLPSLSSDYDEDGLSMEQEIAQGTADNAVDSDADGLDDYIESVYFSEREDIFCGIQCAYPDPAVKDLYLEIDWMKNELDEDFKPTSTELSPIVSLYSNQDVNLHIDTGQYGGGNLLSAYEEELPYASQAGVVDFGDYKSGGDGLSANFNSDRAGIWRYMISGHKFLENPMSSGWAEAMGDELFVSTGLIREMTNVDPSDGVRNTIAHELGHSLCLSSMKYFEEQPDECVYAGIDNSDTSSPFYNSINYVSVMNYYYQLSSGSLMPAYSHGTFGQYDHDDWRGIKLGIGAFNGKRTLVGGSQGRSAVNSDPSRVILEGMTIQ